MILTVSKPHYHSLVRDSERQGDNERVTRHRKREITRLKETQTRLSFSPAAELASDHPAVSLCLASLSKDPSPVRDSLTSACSLAVSNRRETRQSGETPPPSLRSALYTVSERYPESESREAEGMCKKQRRYREGSAPNHPLKSAPIHRDLRESEGYLRKAWWEVKCEIWVILRISHIGKNQHRALLVQF